MNGVPSSACPMSRIVDHVRVAADVGGKARLAEEAHDHFARRAFSVLFAEQLDRDVPAEPGVLGTIDFAHAPRAEQRRRACTFPGEGLPPAREFRRAFAIDFYKVSSSTPSEVASG